MNIEIAQAKFFDYSTYIRGYSKATIRRYTFVLSTFKRFAHIEVLTDITEKNVRELFYHGRIVKKWRPATYLTYYNSLQVFFAWAVKEGYLQSNPISTLEKVKLEKSLPLRLKKDDSLRLLEIIAHYPYRHEFVRYRNYAMFSMFLFAGLRLHELLNLKYTDVDIENATIFIKNGKGNKDRFVPMTKPLIESLKTYLIYRRKYNKTCPEFFASNTENIGFTLAGLKKIVIDLRVALGIPFSIHKLRHTFATLMLEGGCDIYSLSQMMGHSDIKTTTIYLYASADHLKKEISKHPLNTLSPTYSGR